MGLIDTTGVIVVFAGLLALIMGYTFRQRRVGPVLIAAGVATMISVVVIYVLRTLS
ncbi:hypothetical protein [Aerolutibacter ruishenii]|uniref:Uncharacterized protein n=1 Tax=Aerolutibacter ruishenii TaxID=686800 RepID=A0A562LVH3_9GAMM|nr:hypothetical protein [Lysobacter ruishenii]TWI11651.1 hypothetical protein IP93_01553 [Lysobacter ruishenii]